LLFCLFQMLYTGSFLLTFPCIIYIYLVRISNLKWVIPSIFLLYTLVPFSWWF
jgi:hypothetical protein